MNRRGIDSMPDWLAHVMLGFSVSTVMRMKGYQRVLFLIGNVLPDLVRFASIFTRFIDSTVLTKFVTFPINYGSHSILGVIVYALFLSIFFKSTLAPCLNGGTQRAGDGVQETTRIAPVQPRDVLFTGFHARLAPMMEKPLFLLILGGILHLFLDTFMWPWAGGVNWLYPLEGAAFAWSFKVIWPTDYDAILVLLPVTIACILVDIFIVFKEKHGGMPNR